MYRIIMGFVSTALIATSVHALPLAPEPPRHTLTQELLNIHDTSLIRSEKFREITRLTKAGQIKEANLVIAKLLTDNPNDKAALELAGISLMQMQNFKVAEESFRRLTTMPPVSASVVTRYGVTKIFNGDIEGGVKLLRQIIQREPNNPLANRYLGWAAESAGDARSAVNYLKNLPSVPAVGLREYHVALARNYSNLQDHGKIVDLLEPAFPEGEVGQDPLAVGAGLHLTLAYAAAGEKSKAAALRSAVRPRISSNPVSLFGLDMGLAMISGDVKAGRSAVDSLKRAAPQLEVKARSKLLELHLNRRDVSGAIDELEAVLDLADEIESAVVLKTMVPVLIQENMNRYAIKTLEGVTKKFPLSDEFAYGLAELQSISGMRSKSLLTVDKLVNRAKPHAPAYLLGATLARADGKRDLAHSYLEKYLKIEPSRADGWIALAGYHFEAGNMANAIQALHSGIDRNTNDPQLKYELGTLYQMEGRLQLANQQYKAVLNLNAGHMQAMDNLASNLLDMNNELENAYDIAQRLSRAMPGDPYIQDLMGWALYRTGDFKKAENYLTKAAASIVDSGRADYHLALTLKELGATEKAGLYFRSALKKGLSAKIQAEVEMVLSASK